MSDNGKAVINLTSGHEDADKVTVAFLVARQARRRHATVGMDRRRGDRLQLLKPHR